MNEAVNRLFNSWWDIYVGSMGLSWSCMRVAGDGYEAGYAACEKAIKADKPEFRPYPVGPRFPCNCAHGEDPRHCKVCRGSKMAKPDDPKAADDVMVLDPTHAVRLKVPCSGIPELDAMIRELRWWEAVLAAMQGLLAGRPGVWCTSGMAEVACQYADAVLAEVDKRAADTGGDDGLG